MRSQRTDLKAGNCTEVGTRSWIGWEVVVLKELIQRDLDKAEGERSTRVFLKL